MGNDIEALKRLAELDDLIWEKQQKAEELPRSLGEAETRKNQLLKKIEEIQEDIQRVQKESNLAELEVKSIEEEINSYKVKRNTVKTNEEYRLITEKIKELQDKKSQQEEGAIIFLTEADEFGERLKEVEAQVAEEDKRIEAIRLEVENTVKVLLAEIEELKGQREGIAAEIDPQSLEKYERVRAKLKSNVVVRVINGTCEGCYLSVPPNDENNIMAGKIIVCRHCNRILYLGDE